MTEGGIDQVTAVVGDAAAKPGKSKRTKRTKADLTAKRKADVQAQRAASADAKGVLFRDYDIVVMRRRDIQGADYNPRIMRDEERKRLRDGVKKHGNLNPPNVNKRSVEKGWPEGSLPTLMGGHQRLSVFDTLAGTADYQVEVALADKTPIEEKEANILLNNPQAQGDWDLERLENLLRDPLIDLSGTGFDLADTFRLLGDMPGAQAPDVDELAAKLRGFQEAYTKVSDNTGRDDFYIVVVFRDHAARKAFLDGLKFDDNRYQSGVALLERMQAVTAIEPAKG